MDKAVEAIWAAVEAKKSITIFADYDVDGATSAAQLIRWGRAIGCEFGLYVPDRVKEGYGPSIAAFKTLKAQGVDTVITVDCGAAAEAPLKAADGLGLDIIVIDHHQMGDDIPTVKDVGAARQACQTLKRFFRSPCWGRYVMSYL